MEDERDSASARYSEVYARICRIFKACEVKKDKPADTLVRLRELFDQGYNVAIPKHSAKLAMLWVKVVSWTNGLEVNEFEFQTLPALVDKKARLHEELNKVAPRR